MFKYFGLLTVATLISCSNTDDAGKVDNTETSTDNAGGSSNPDKPGGVGPSEGPEQPDSRCAALASDDDSLDGPEPSEAVPEVVGLAAGSGYACSLHADGSVRCWGVVPPFRSEQSYEIYRRPILIEGLPAAKQITAGESFACTLDEDSRVWCWGFGPPIAGGNEPQEIPEASGALEVRASFGLACALRADGTVYCWGDADNFDLEGGPLFGGFDVVGVNSAVSIAMGGTQACALLADGSAVCWGALLAPGELTAYDRAIRLPPEGPEPLQEITQLSLSPTIQPDQGRGCALLASGEVWCWDSMFELPHLVDELSPASNVSLGENFACAGLPAGDVRCLSMTGAIPPGAFGTGANSADVGGLGMVDELHAGHDFVCARTDSDVLCWGSNQAAQLGAGAPSGRTELPTRVRDVEAASAIALSNGVFGAQACVISETGQLHCWTDHSAPGVQLEGVQQVALGQMHSCALMQDGELQCWGLNTAGQLGLGDTGAPDVPIPVLGPGDVLEVAVALEVTCIRNGAGSVYCWGNNASGLLGSAVDDSSPAPIPVAGIEGAVSIALAERYTPSIGCAVVDGGALISWGKDEFSDATASVAPRTIEAPAPAVRVVGGESSCCALLDDGTLACWRADDTNATRLDGVDGVTSFAIGGTQLCAVLDRCGLTCFQFGASTLSLDGGRSYGLSDATSVATSGNRSCAATPQGAYCWGDRPLGDGVEPRSDAPVPISF